MGVGGGWGDVGAGGMWVLGFGVRVQGTWGDGHQ